MSNAIKHRLRKAQKSVTTWLGASSAISTPQLVKRTLHVTYNTETGNFTGVPVQWQSEFEKAASIADSRPKKQPFLRDHQSVSMDEPESKNSRNLVWYDQSTCRFVNLPKHWQERLLRNNLSDWLEFQRNPNLLTIIFTLMDDELKAMDLSSLGLDSTIYSSASSTSTAERENQNELSPHQDQQSTNQPKESPKRHPGANLTRAASMSRDGTVTSPGAIVWTQQRSFGKDDEIDSEEFAEL